MRIATTKEKSGGSLEQQNKILQKQQKQKVEWEAPAPETTFIHNVLVAQEKEKGESKVRSSMQAWSKRKAGSKNGEGQPIPSHSRRRPLRDLLDDFGEVHIRTSLLLRPRSFAESLV